MAQWLEPPQAEIPEDILAVVDRDPLIASTLIQRGISSAEAARGFLNPDDYHPAPPTDLPDVALAADRLDDALRQGEMVGVWGDFDADGVTSTALLIEALRQLGGRVDFYVPDRLTESHGIHIPTLQRLISKGIRVLLTCDTGSTDHEALAYAAGQGVDVIITDHHDFGPDAPRAHAFVNPKRLPLESPLYQLTGVGTAYKLAEELYRRHGQSEKASELLDLVALGQIADVAVLQRDVRYLVQRGIEVLRHTQRLGMRALLEVANLQPEGITEEQISYGLAPRLNALGRLSEATAAVELFTTSDIVRARTIATEMEALNVERQALCNQVMAAAVSLIERDSSLLREPVLVIDHADWPGGVIGIVAGRLAQRYNRPVVIISTSSDGLARGSARSIPGVDIRAAIAAQSDLLLRFGGHPMAAGLSLAAENIPALRGALARTVSTLAGKEVMQPSLSIAGYLSFSSLSVELATRVEKLAPFGAGNPPVYLATRGVKLLGYTTIGRMERHRRLTLEDATGSRATVLWWHGADVPLPDGPFDLAYTLRTRDYLGYLETQVEWQDARPVRDQTEVRKPAPPAAQVTDCRADSQAQGRLRKLLSQFQERKVEIWSEGLPSLAEDIHFHRRDRLNAADVLIIWTMPPGPQELRQALERVSPRHVVLFTQHAGLDEPQAFLTRLAGMLKYDLSTRAGRSRVAELAAALGHTEATVRQGAACLEARGQIKMLSDEAGILSFERGDGKARGEVDAIHRQLDTLLSETVAYRSYFRRADIQSLVQER